MVSLNSWSWKGGRTQMLSKGFVFVFEFRIRRTIKRDANLVGLRKIECSSIKIKSKERHSSTPRARRIFFSDCWCRKSRLMPEVLMPSHLACAVTVAVGSPDSGQESWHLDLGWLADHTRRMSRRMLGVPTLICSLWLWPSYERCFLYRSKVLRSMSELPT